MTSFTALRSSLLALDLAAVLAPSAWAQCAPQAGDQAQAQPVTREEVLADLALWRRAGLDRIEAVEGFDASSPAYLSAKATYQQLRSSPAYAAEVAHLRSLNHAH